MNSQKLLRKALGSPQSLRFTEAVQLAKAFGFVLDRISGSHHIFKRSGVPELLNLQNVKGMAKAYQVRQLLKIAEKHNLPLTE
jgi:HicA-like toxin of HicAB toxin-antitoxin system